MNDMPAAPTMPTDARQGYPPKLGKTYDVTVADGVGALGALVAGLLFWWWICPRKTAVSGRRGTTGGWVWYVVNVPGVVAPIFFGLVLAASMAYFHHRGVRLRPATIVGAVVIMVGALPFAFFAPTPIHLLLFFAVLAGTILWHGLAASTLVAPRLSADLVADVVNQGLCVPLRNFGAFLAGVRFLVKNHHRTSRVIVGLVGLLIALPVMAVVVLLLGSADQGFADLLGDISQAIASVGVWGFVWRLVLAIPTAMYIFGLAWGDAHHVRVDTVTTDRLRHAAASVRRISLSAIAAPLVGLCLIYVVFFFAMGTYLFEAFAGRLPGGFTYADYARRGFFELSAVAAINLAVLGFTYLFAKRSHEPMEPGPTSPTTGTYPMFLRVAGVVLAGLTLLLIATAESKMALYIRTYGLTQLRLFTTVFMAMLAVIFVLVAIWHIHPFRVSGTIIVIAVVTLLGLGWCDPNGLIAHHNVDAYLDGSLARMDLGQIEDLGEAGVPALIDLCDQADDQSVRQGAVDALSEATVYRIPVDAAAQAPWTSWNLQSWLVGRELGAR